MESWMVSLRVALATMLICVAGYTLVVWGVAHAASAHTAEGSLIRRPDGGIVGSRLIAQKFEEPRYFWPRPSAPDYNASGAAGSNKSPISTDITERAATTVALSGASASNPLPTDLAAASGSGLDPHITEHAALYQAERVAGARGLPIERVQEIIEKEAFSPGGPLTPDRLVNVLELNLAVDRETAPATASR